MRVVHVATSAIHGGAGRAARRLHEAMLVAGIDSHMITGDDPVSLNAERIPAAMGVTDGLAARSRVERARTIWAARSRGRVFSSGLHRSDRLQKRLKDLSPNIVNLHWVGAGFLGVHDLNALPAPVVWTMCDMWPVTGGCHYAGACDRYTMECGSCPTLGARSNLDLSRKAWTSKAFAYSKLPRIAFVAKSSWMTDIARRSSLGTGHRIYQIPNGIETEKWKPLDQREARTRLGISIDQPAVAFVADSILDPRKGFDLAVKSVRKMRAQSGPLTVLAVGSGDPHEIRGSSGLDDTDELRCFGKVQDAEILRAVYSASDVTLLTSRDENLANVALESLACSTPVVAFAVGGNADVVTPGVSGWLSPAFDTTDLARAALSMIGDQVTRESARREVVERFSWGSVVNEYLLAYRELTAP